MDNAWILGLVGMVLSFILLYRSFGGRISRSRHRCPLPLGTLGWPLIGETFEFISCAYSDHPESFMDKRRRMYGNVFKSHIFGNPTIISTDAEVSRFVMQSDSKVFVPSYPRSLTELMGKSSILLINGSIQRRVHALIGAFFKSPHVKAQITQDMQKYVQESMDTWKDNHLIYIQDETKNVLVKALISLEPGEEMKFLKQRFQEFIAGLISLPVKIPGSRLYRSLQAKKRMVKLVHEIIQDRRRSSSSSSPNVPRDVVDVLLNDTSEQLTDELISDNMIDFMIPGEDSVPLLITLAIKYLSDSPIALHQLTEENMKLKRLKAKLGEPLCWSDYMDLQFTQNVITETLRLGNIIIGVMRKAMKDVEIKGYLIPKGWCVFTYFRSVHLDEQHYDWPYQFNPWRWQDKDTGSCNFTPFGGGQRLCPGLDLARLEASIFLHHFVTQFRWVAEDDSVINFPTVRLKKRMPVLVKRREIFLCYQFGKESLQGQNNKHQMWQEILLWRHLSSLHGSLYLQPFFPHLGLSSQRKNQQWHMIMQPSMAWDIQVRQRSSSGSVLWVKQLQWIKWLRYFAPPLTVIILRVWGFLPKLIVWETFFMCGVFSLKVISKRYVC